MFRREVMFLFAADDLRQVQEVMERLIKDPAPRIRLLAAGYLLASSPEHSLAQEIVVDSLSSDSLALRKAAQRLVESLEPEGFPNPKFGAV